MTCWALSVSVQWRPFLPRAVVTQLVTHYLGLDCSSEQCQLALDSSFSNLIPAMISVIIRSMADQGTVYLLHFERPYKGRLRHYLGFTQGDVEQRLENHRRGTACATTKVAFDGGSGLSSLAAGLAREG